MEKRLDNKTHLLIQAFDVRTKPHRSHFIIIKAKPFIYRARMVRISHVIVFGVLNVLELDKDAFKGLVIKRVHLARDYHVKRIIVSG